MVKLPLACEASPCYVNKSLSELRAKDQFKQRGLPCRDREENKDGKTKSGLYCLKTDRKCLLNRKVIEIHEENMT